MALVVALCRAAFDETFAPDLLSATADLDWDLFLKLAAFHRVEGLAWRGIQRFGQSIPSTVREQLSENAKAIAARNLAMTLEAGRLNALFDDARVPLLFLKGLPLAVMAYGDVTAKSAADIDLLVTPTDLDAARGVLADAGYRLVLPSSTAALARWHRHHKESAWRQPATGTIVDLHTAMTEGPGPIPDRVLRRSTVDVAIGNGISVSTIGGEALPAYLAAHGASSAWFRLKWVADFAALLAQRRGAIGPLRATIASWGAARTIDQALLVADSMFEVLENEPEVRAVVARDQRARAAARIALGYLTRPGEPVEPTGRRFDTLGIHAAQLLVQPGLAPSVAAVGRKLRLLLAGPRA